MPQFSIDNVVVNESGNAVFTVQRTGVSLFDAEVEYSVQSGSATAGSDFTALSGTFTMSTGETRTI